jgi:hypothetical protein
LGLFAANTVIISVVTPFCNVEAVNEGPKLLTKLCEFLLGQRVFTQGAISDEGSVDLSFGLVNSLNQKILALL